ncbi:MAG: response regulator [Gammaproteobacteria bacterium]|nr:response regulator [Gammaproteobacteria bacterium]MCF6230922.1 response regulator [Gammaproteobacteria bacterium]
MNEVRRVLIVDDERFHLNVMADLLGEEHNILVAKDGSRALEIAATKPVPDLILLDVLMPEMDGYEVCKRLKRDPRTRHIPVIFLTVKSDVDDEKYGFDLGAVDYITKPYSVPIVKARVATHLALSRALCELAQQNELLEKRVRERTQEIVQAHEMQEKLQRCLQRAHKMESIGLLAGGIAHDFNNILTSVEGFSNIALYDIQMGEYESAAQNIEDIVLASSRAAGLVQQLLAFSRGVPSKPQVFPPVDIISEAITLLRPVLPAMVHFDVSLDETVPDILFDKVQMHQVVMNLCINARDAMNSRGHLAISLTYQRGVKGECSACHHSFAGDFVVLEVSDDGSGMGEEQVKSIFDPFFSTKAEGKGTGMGLSVVNDIVHKHQGHLQLDTELGKGSTFKLLFPTAQAAVSHSEPALSHHLQVDNNILLVSDDVSVSMLWKELLDVSGYQVTIRNSGQEALDLLLASNASFDLVIADQSMQGMGGQALAEAIVAENLQMPVIVCEDNGGVEVVDDHSKAISTILRKPVQSDTLMHEIVSLIPAAKVSQ